MAVMWTNGHHIAAGIELCREPRYSAVCNGGSRSYNGPRNDAHWIRSVLLNVDYPGLSSPSLFSISKPNFHAYYFVFLTRFDHG